MGEVYKAQDLTLERTVALKVLPEELVRNEERVRRFVQEAKSASSLNHPHIVTIHEIGQAGSIHFIAMELVDGLTLKAKIHEERTDLRTLLQYLAQAADGLAKAHAAGIVHRDLKPENIMVTRDGFAKVLDFGLAKLSAKKSASETTTERTEVRNQTREGAVMGTVAYMSPEQVQGKVVDHRSDIFSFGCILYEAATRQRPFDADSDVDLMHKILHDKPQPVDELNPAAPAELRRMVRRCLAKDPEKRYQSMKDLAIELEDIVLEYDELSASATSASGSVAPIARRLSIRGAAGVVALLIIAAALFGWYRSRSVTVAPLAFQSMTIQRIATAGQGLVNEAAVAPDGKYLAYVIRDSAGKFSLWVRQVATGSDVQVVAPNKTGFHGFAFSPDGNYLFYVSAEQEAGAAYSWLYQVPTLGGTPRKLIFDVDTGPTFSPDGKQLAFGRGDLTKKVNLLLVANIDGTSPRVIETRKRFGAPHGPSWSPDGKKIATGKIDSTGGFHAELIEVDAATGKERPIGTTRWRVLDSLAWLPDRSGLLVVGMTNEIRRAQVWLQPYPDGALVRVTNDTNQYGTLSTTADGKTFATMRFEDSMELVVTDPVDAGAAKPLPVVTDAQRIAVVSVANNGTIVYQYGTDRGPDIAILEKSGAPSRTLSHDSNSYQPSITADGTTIVFGSRRAGDIPHIFAMDAEGTNVRQLTHGGGEAQPRISADGKTILYTTPESKLFRMNGDGGAVGEIADRFNGAYAMSPDGTKVAYTYIAHESQRDVPRLRIASLMGGPVILDVPWQENGPARWSPKNDGFTINKVVDGATNIFFVPLTGGTPVPLTHFKKGFISSYDWTPEGKLVLARGETHSEMILVSNFR